MGEDRRAGFEEFVRGQSASLLRLAYLLTGDVHAGEDLLQGVLEKMYLRWHRIRRDPVAYARRALVNPPSRTVAQWG
jgi:DNA-directed RNA polymerase specialized sigma24 family protein